jgi:hypothetical protein
MYLRPQVPAYDIDSIGTEFNVEVQLFNALDSMWPRRSAIFTYSAPPLIYKAVFSSDRKHVRLHLSQVLPAFTFPQNFPPNCVQADVRFHL